MHSRKILKISVLIIFFILITSYALFQARRVIEGPVVTIVSPSDGSSVDTPNLKIIGQTKNIAFLYLNGRKIYTNDQGDFEETILVGEGVNMLELKATDKFGKEIIRGITVFKK